MGSAVVILLNGPALSTISTTDSEEQPLSLPQSGIPVGKALRNNQKALFWAEGHRDGTLVTRPDLRRSNVWGLTGGVPGDSERGAAEGSSPEQRRQAAAAHRAADDACRKNVGKNKFPEKGVKEMSSLHLSHLLLEGCISPRWGFS